MFEECDVIQNFEYPAACLDINLSENKKYVVSVGTYQPCVKVHDLYNLTEKSTRHLESDPVKVVSLTKYADKLAILRVDRYIEMHARYGMHERIRVPCVSYDLKFNKHKSELLSCGKSSEIQRFDLENGCFMSSYKTSLPLITCMDINQVHGLVGCTGHKGMEFIDQRVEKTVNYTKTTSIHTAFSYSENGINFATGTKEGKALIYDLRSSTPLKEYSHVTDDSINDNIIKKVKMVNKAVLSADSNILLVHTDEKTESIKCDKKINTFEQDGGVIFIGLDGIKMKTFYSLEFGYIPDWCNVLRT